MKTRPSLVALSAFLLAWSASAHAADRSQPREQSGGRHAPPTHPDVSYGPHERNVMDVWLAAGEEPTPVLVAIHGGGSMQGQKHVHPRLREECLASGISVVAITYRLSSAEARAPAQFLDAARAIQFIRHEARDWHLDPDRIAATGGSAGAGLSLWLGFHDDLADPDSQDPVLRQSSRLTCMAVFNGQTSYDPRVIRELLPESDAYEHVALAKLFDVDLSRLDELPREKYQLFEEVSPITHLTRDDPPALLAYESEMDTPPATQSIAIHHPRFGKMLKEHMDKLGIESRVYVGVRKNSQESTRLTIDFVEKHFGIEP